jgi:3-deoxy-D-manno-octulosonate 8-phosphate phosphatase (KDO 8-P phosphatase)
MSVLKLFKPITTFVFDVDGVLTDGTIFLFDNGEQVRRMNIKDGYALQLAIKKGYRVVVISGANTEAVKTRLNKLGVHDVFMQVENKEEKLSEYIKTHQLDWKHILFMGDDIPDYAVMKKAGLSCAPADAVGAIRDIAKYISTVDGGKGCVRDVIEKVLKLNGHWEMDTGVASR